MEKAKMLYAIDALLGIAFAASAFSGVLMFFKQERILGAVGITQRVLWEMHANFGILFILLALVHIFLHLDWIKAMTKQIFFRKNA